MEKDEKEGLNLLKKVEEEEDEDNTQENLD